jgi:hypothetical protein
MLCPLERVGIGGSRLTLVFGIYACLLWSSDTQQASGEQLIGLTVQNSLISFDSATPGTTNFIGAITGLTAGDSLVGIDRRPSLGPNNGLIYTVGVNPADGSARIYTLNETTAAATLVTTLAADPADATAPSPFTTVAGTSFGIDFNPVPDRLRLTSNTGQNLRMNVDNGLVQLDVPLSYQAGDPNFGDAPVDVAVAYSNSFGGATSTTLRGVDIGQDPDALVVHTNPNGGTLMTALTLPFNSTDVTAYDVSGLSGTPYFTATGVGSSTSDLFAAGPGGVTLVGNIGGGVALLGLAAPIGTPIPEPVAGLLLGLGALCMAGSFRLGRRYA